LVGRFLLITHSIVYFAIMTQTFSSFSEFSSGLGPTFMSGAATSCHSQALAYRGQVFETHGDCQADCQPTSDRSTRGNSPRTGDSRTKLKLRSKPVDPRALGLRAALEATASDQQAATEGVQTPADKENDTNLDNAWPRVSVRDLAPGLNKPRSLKPSSEAFQGDCEVKYKTELCRNFELTGRCKYGNKCSYAHGRDELVNKKHINLHYKSKKCNKFFENGFCEYGARCQYLHQENSHVHILDAYCEKLLVWMERNPQLEMSSIMKKTHAFGNRNSFFTKLEQNVQVLKEESKESL
jgi:hypothetical protein